MKAPSPFFKNQFCAACADDSSARIASRMRSLSGLFLTSIFFLVKATGNVSLAALSMMIVMLPLFFLAMYEKDGQPLEVVVEHFIQTKFVRPKVRPYQTDNYYDALMRQYKLEKEVERIVFQKEAAGKKHQNACKSESEAAARN